MHTNYYTYRILWSPEDEQHIGLCAEFPSLSYSNAQAENALTGIMNLVSETIEGMKKSGKEVPIPSAYIKYSGTFQLNIMPELHRKLAIDAAKNGMSLDQHISSKL